MRHAQSVWRVTSFIWPQFGKATDGMCFKLGSLLAPLPAMSGKAPAWHACTMGSVPHSPSHAAPLLLPLTAHSAAQDSVTDAVHIFRIHSGFDCRLGKQSNEGCKGLAGCRWAAMQARTSAVDKAVAIADRLQGEVTHGGFGHEGADAVLLQVARWQVVGRKLFPGAPARTAAVGTC